MTGVNSELSMSCISLSGRFQKCQSLFHGLVPPTGLNQGSLYCEMDWIIRQDFYIR